MNKFRKILYCAKRFIRSNKTTIITVGSCVGVMATTGLSIHAGYKTGKLVEEHVNWDKKDILKATWPNYLAVGALNIATIGTIVSNHKINKSIQTSLVTAYGMLQHQHDIYKASVREAVSDEQMNTIETSFIEKNISLDNIERGTEEDFLFVDEFSGRPFYALKESVLLAINELNRNFALKGEVSYNDFCRMLINLPEIPELGEDFGWDIESGEAFYGYEYIDVEFDKVVNNDGSFYYLMKLPFGPHPMYEDLDEKGVWEYVNGIDDATADDFISGRFAKNSGILMK